MMLNMSTCKQILLPVFSVFFIISGCTAGTTSLTHYLTYSAKGTRSEARHGHLRINGKEVPKAFSCVAYGGRSYSMRYRSNLWGADGYHPDSPARLPLESSAPVSRTALARGYYLGSERLSGTPSTWIFVRWDKEKAAFAAPDKLPVLIRDQEISPVSPFMPFKQKRLKIISE